MKSCLVCCLLLVCAVSPARSTVTGTPDSVFAFHLAGAAAIYAKLHDGRSPTSWQDIQLYLDVESGYHHLRPTVRYAFLDQSLFLPAPHEGELVVIARRPFRDTLLPKAGRYIVFRKRNGSFGSAPVRESYVRQVFSGSESLLPTPDTEPERSWVREARWRSIFGWSCVALISIPVIYLLSRRRDSSSLHAKCT